MVTALRVLRHDVLQHVDVEGGVEGDVGNQLQRLVLVWRLLQLCRLLAVRSVSDGEEDYGRYDGDQAEHTHGSRYTQDPAERNLIKC